MSYTHCTVERRPGRPVDTGAGKDFFISYTSTDKQWAEWIAWCLEQQGYSIIIQAWDFPAGSNFVYEMDQALKRARRVVAILSPTYLASEYAFSEWAEAFRHDPQGKQHLLLPVRVQPCGIEGLLGSIVYIDLVACNEQQARERLLAGAQGHQPHPSVIPFPGPPVTQAHPAFPAPFPVIWNVPYPRNPYFTGRKQLLANLAQALRKEQATALSQPQAINGLGGVGKTQIALEYVYQYHQDYEAVFWIRADTRDAIISGFIEIATLLSLPQKDTKEVLITVQAVQQWMRTHTKWLLILDNADDLVIVREFVPSA